MKNNLFLLTINNFKNMIKIKGKNKKGLIGLGIVFIYAIIIVMLATGMIINEIFNVLKTFNMESFFLPLAFAVTMIFTFMFSIFMSKAWLFEVKDNELLLSLPIKKQTILASRLLNIIIYNFTICLLFLIPTIYIYLSNISFTFIFLLIVVLALIFLPIIPTILASLFGYLVAFLTSKASLKSLVEVIVNFMFLVCYFILYYNINGIISNLITKPELLNNILKYGFYPIYLIFQGITTNNILYILLFAVLNIAVFAIFTFILNKSYFKIISGLSSQKTKNNYKIKDMKEESVKKTLLNKELKRYFGTPSYIFNTAFGVILLGIFSIISLFASKESIIKLININESLTSFSLVFVAVLFIVALTNTTCASISLERESFWILKSSPIKEKDIFTSKILVNIIIVMPILILSLIIFNISNYINTKEMLLLILMAFSLNLAVSLLGLISNLAMPNLHAESDIAIVKRSPSVFVTTIVPMIIVMTLIMIFLGNIIDAKRLLMLITGVSFVISSVFVFVLKGWGTNRFKEIN